MQSQAANENSPVNARIRGMPGIPPWDVTIHPGDAPSAALGWAGVTGMPGVAPCANAGARDDPRWAKGTSARLPAHLRRADQGGRAYPCDGGELRREMIAKELADAPIGIAVLCYQQPDLAERCIRSIQRAVNTPHVLRVYDNSEDFRTGAWFTCHAPEVEYVKMLGNVGCSNVRNRMAEDFGAMGLRYFVVCDQDVEFDADPLPAFAAMFREFPNTGVVGYEGLIRTAGWDRRVGADGLVPEISGVCSMYRMEAVLDAGGWCPDYFLYVGEDTYICCAAGKRGWTTRVIQGKCPMRHVAPNSGMKMNPWQTENWHRSIALFHKHCERFGFERLI